MQVDETTLGFLEKLNADPSLQAELGAALGGGRDRTDAILAVAASRGFQIDRESFAAARETLAKLRDSGALNERQLEAVVAGLNPQPLPPRWSYDFLYTIQPVTWSLFLG